MASSSENIGKDLLWHECARHTVNVPRVGDRVFYFPQGHLEHVVALMNVDGNTIVPSNSLPSKISCKVVDVQLKADLETEEFHCQITLLPSNEEDETEVPTIRSVPENVGMSCFRRILTAREVNKPSSFTLHNEDEIKIFPLLTGEDEAVSASQDIVAKDLHGATWHFGHMYRDIKRKYILGFGEAVRMRKQPPRAIPFSAILNGIISNAYVSINQGTELKVYYYPRATSRFIVAYNEVMESLQVNYSDGMRFQMLCDEGRKGGDNVVQTLTGTITDVEDIDPIRWRNSEWRRLRVRWGWGAAIYRNVLPQRVSPWSIRPFNVAAQR